VPPTIDWANNRNKSALELTSHFDPASVTGGLRKVASIANYNLVHRDSANSTPVNTPSSHPNTHLTPFAQHFGHLNSASHHSISTIPEDQDQGLMMSVRSTSGLVVTNAMNQSGARGGLMEAATSSNAAGTTASPPRSVRNSQTM
jgi:hypothetical protein